MFTKKSKLTGIKTKTIMPSYPPFSCCCFLLFSIKIPLVKSCLKLQGITQNHLSFSNPKKTGSRKVTLGSPI